jgi:Xaa-Pro aminopeptidase
MTVHDSSATVREFIAREEAAIAARTPELSFTREEYAARLARLRARMADDGLDVLILTAPDAMGWLHGYRSRWYRQTSSTALPPGQCTVVHVEAGMFMVEVGYHAELVRLTSCIEDVRTIAGTDANHESTVDGFAGFLAGELARERWLGGTVGLERWSCVPSPAVSDVLEAALRERGCRVVDATAAVRGVRRLKSPAEIATIERAQRACDAGLLAIQREVTPGTTELEAWSAFMSAAVAAGGEPAAIHETVAVGPPLAVVHGLSSRRPIRAGECFHADMAAAVDRYHARGTRFFVHGEPDPALHRLAEAVAGAYDVVLANARIGMPLRDLYPPLRDYYAEAVPGVEAASSGYELGLSFPPDWVGELTWSTEEPELDVLIEPGLVLCFESTAHVAMVDTLVFEADGPRFLSTVPREVLVAGEPR